jgi:hypothetical protein
MFLKIEQKASQGELFIGIAREELAAKFHQDALRVFPRGHRSTIGFASAGGLIDMVEITAVENGSFSCHLLKSFNLLRHLRGELAFWTLW